MWKEIINYKDMVKAVKLRSLFGCAMDYSADIMKAAIERKKDCHYFYYKSDTIELLKGFKEKDGFISLIAYSIKADVEDYPEAIRLMAENAKDYIKNRKIKKIVFQQGSKDIELMNSANLGVSKIGFDKFIEIVIEEYGKLGFKTTFTKDAVINEMM